jgi:hypothetical protein
MSPLKLNQRRLASHAMGWAGNRSGSLPIAGVERSSAFATSDPAKAGDNVVEMRATL